MSILSLSIESKCSYAEAYQNLAVFKFLIGNIKGSRKSFKKALMLFIEQVRRYEVNVLRRQLTGVVRLDDLK